jgi:hypothetical protein
MYRSIPDAALWVISAGGHTAVRQSEEAFNAFPTVVHKFFQGD